MEKVRQNDERRKESMMQAISSLKHVTTKSGIVIKALALLLILVVLFVPAGTVFAEDEDGDNGTVRQQADKILKGNIGTFGQKVSRLADIVMIIGAMGALLSFAVIGARMTLGGWNMENLKQCKSGVMVIMFGVLLALSSKLLAGVIYQAVK
ncbi:MAG: hypothetical protein ACYC4E_00985 [Carboxydocellales bacterium]